MSPILRQVLLICIVVIHLCLYSYGYIVCRERKEDVSSTTLWMETLQSKEMLKKLSWNKLHLLNIAAGRTLNTLFASDVDFLRRRLNLTYQCVDEHNRSEIETKCNAIIAEQYPQCHGHNQCLNILHGMDICRMTRYREECKEGHTGLDSRKMDDFRKLLLVLVTFFKSIYHQDGLIAKVMYEKGDVRNTGKKSRTLITIKLHHKYYTFFMDLPLSSFELDEAGTMVALEAWTLCNPESQVIRTKQVMYSSASGTRIFHSVHAHIDSEKLAVSGGCFSYFLKNGVILIVIVSLYLI